MAEPATDWRGTPIEPGALVIYGAPVGRSIAMVEATVANPMLTPSGRIWLDVVRRSYGHVGTEVGRVHVGADRLTVVSLLPPSDLPTAADLAAEALARREEWERKQAAAVAECAVSGHVWAVDAGFGLGRLRRCIRCHLRDADEARL